MNNNQQFPPAPPRGIPPQYQSPNNYSYGHGVPPKKSNAGLVVGIIAGIVFLVVVIALMIFAFIAFSTPSTADYKKARDHVGEMLTDYRTLLKNPDDKALVDKFKKDAKELSKMKAVNKDKDIKAAHGKFVDKLPKFIDSLQSGSAPEDIIGVELRDLNISLIYSHYASTL